MTPAVAGGPGRDASGEVAYIPERLNEQPVVVLGLTDGELRHVALAALAALVPLGTAAGMAFGQLAVGMGGGAVGAIGAVYVAGKVLRRLKRGKPVGYHADLMRAWLEDRGIGGDSMMRRSAVWEAVRTVPRAGRRAAGGDGTAEDEH